jgi:hypothetical protein
MEHRRIHASIAVGMATICLFAACSTCYARGNKPQGATPQLTGERTLSEVSESSFAEEKILRQRLIDRVRIEYGSTGGKRIGNVDIYLRKNEETSPIKYVVMNSYDILLQKDQGDPVLLQFASRGVALYLEGKFQDNRWDSLAFLSNYPISRWNQQAAAKAYGIARTRAERVAIVLAFRLSPLTGESSRFLSDLLSAEDDTIRTAALIALMPRSIHHAHGNRSEYDVQYVLDRITRMVGAPISPGWCPLILSIVGEPPFLGKHEGIGIAERIHQVRSESNLENEFMDYYWTRIVSAKRSPNTMN